jgi:hypothetical protein
MNIDSLMREILMPTHNPERPAKGGFKPGIDGPVGEPLPYARPAFTADGLAMSVGMVVCRIYTRDAGKTWYVSGPHTITEIRDTACAFEPPEPGDFMEGRGWHETLGHNRFYACATQALAECARLMARDKP